MTTADNLQQLAARYEKMYEALKKLQVEFAMKETELVECSSELMSYSTSC